MKKLGIVLFVGLVGSGCEPKTKTTAPDDSSHEAHHAEGSEGTDAETSAGGPKHEGMAHACPMKVPNTKPSVQEVEGGVALVFETNAENVAALQEKARKMAAMHSKHHGGEASSDEGGMHEGGVGTMKVPPSKATAEDTETGARVVFEPLDPEQLQALRDHMSKMAAKMQSGECPMKDHHESKSSSS